MSSYDYDLTNKIPKALDREQNERLHARVMKGDDKAREEMIESNMPLVITGLLQSQVSPSSATTWS